MDTMTLFDSRSLDLGSQYSLTNFVIDKQVTIQGINLAPDDVITFEIFFLANGSLPKAQQGCCFIKPAEMPTITGVEQLTCDECAADGSKVPVRLTASNPVVVLNHPQAVVIRAKYTGSGLGLSTVWITTETSTQDLTPGMRGCPTVCCVPDPDSWQETGERRCNLATGKVEALEVDNCGNEEWREIGDLTWTPTGDIQCRNETGGTNVYQEEVNDCGQFRWSLVGPATWADTGDTRCVGATTGHPNPHVEKKQVNPCGGTQWVYDHDVTWTPTGDIRCRPANGTYPDGYVEHEEVNDCGTTRWVADGAATWTPTGDIRCRPADGSHASDYAEREEVNDCGATRWVYDHDVTWVATGEFRCVPATTGHPDGSVERQESNDCGKLRWVFDRGVTWTDTCCVRCVPGSETDTQKEQSNDCGDTRWVAGPAQEWDATGCKRCLPPDETHPDGTVEAEEINQCGNRRWVADGDNTWTPTGKEMCVVQTGRGVVLREEINSCGGLRWVYDRDQTWVDTGVTKCDGGTEWSQQQNDCGQIRWNDTGDACPTDCDGISAGFSISGTGLHRDVFGIATPSNGATAIASWDWDFGDGSAHVTTQNASHDYASGGNYYVTLTVTDDKGCKAVKSEIISVGMNCDGISAGFSITGTNLTRSFFGSATPSNGATSIASWDWNFGDGSAHGTGQNVGHTYTLPGSYFVVLTVVDDKGCTAVHSEQITVAMQCDGMSAGFSVSGTGLTKNFTDASTPSTGAVISTWDWDFGDGSAHDTSQNPSHAYAAPGTYLVLLTVTDSNGCQASKSISVVVVGTCDGVLAAFSETANALSVSVDGSASTPATGSTISSYDWDWGDSSAHGSGATATHTYATAGSYTITLLVTDSAGCQASKSLTVSVDASCTGMTASFTATAGTGLSVSVDGSASTPATGNTMSTYDWDWGDGSPHGSGATATHTYATAGSYTITLLTTDSGGCQASASEPFAVADPCAGIDALFSVTYGPADYQVKVNAGASTPSTGNSLTTYDWDWGDGSPHGSGATATHTYTSSLSRTITLTVTDDEGCTDTMSKSVTPKQAGYGACFNITSFDVKKNVHSDYTPGPQGPFDTTLTLAFLYPGYQICSGAYVVVDWGDGTPSETYGLSDVGGYNYEIEPNALHPGVDHNYGKSGEYTVKVTIRAYVCPQCEVIRTKVYDLCLATIASHRGFNPDGSTTITITGLNGTFDTGCEPTSMKIDWGDGSPIETVAMTALPVSHTFSPGGTDSGVSAKLIGGCGCDGVTVT